MFFLFRDIKGKLNFTLFISQGSKQNLVIGKLDNNTVEFSNIIPNFISENAICFNTKTKLSISIDTNSNIYDYTRTLKFRDIGLQFSKHGLPLLLDSTIIWERGYLSEAETLFIIVEVLYKKNLISRRESDLMCCQIFEMRKRERM